MLMKMTRQHFERLAFLCADSLEVVEELIGHSEKEAIVSNFVAMCEESNQEFDEERFRARIEEILEARLGAWIFSG